MGAVSKKYQLTTIIWSCIRVRIPRPRRVLEMRIREEITRLNPEVRGGDRVRRDASRIHVSRCDLASIEAGDLSIGYRCVGDLSRRYGGIRNLRRTYRRVGYLGGTDAAVDDLSRAYRRVRDDSRRGRQRACDHVRRCDRPRSDLRARDASGLNPVGVHVA